jgi:hypothetical protein
VGNPASRELFSEAKMTKMMTLMLAALVLCGCNKAITKKQVGRTDNAEADVEVLFTDADGYTVKRFMDNGYPRYYVTPGPAKVASVIPQAVRKGGTVHVPDDTETSK